ncbi:MAG: hypothetical protein ACK44D_01635 [Bacteroidia bacterium]
MKKKVNISFIEKYDHTVDWYYEGNISKAIVTYLKSSGYEIRKDNSDKIRARGEDIIAISGDGIKEIIEVKSYPTEYHTKGNKIGHLKSTPPRLQAEHWFSDVILSSINNYLKHKRQKGKFRLALGFPNMDRYKELKLKVEAFLLITTLTSKYIL